MVFRCGGCGIRHHFVFSTISCGVCGVTDWLPEYAADGEPEPERDRAVVVWSVVVGAFGVSVLLGAIYCALFR